MFNLTRRQFLQHAAAAAPFLVGRPLAAQTADPWARAREIVTGITIPRFAQRDFDITKFGAVGDGASRAPTRFGRQSPPAAPRAAAGWLSPTAGS